LFPERKCHDCDDVRKRKWGCRAYVEIIGGVEQWVNGSELPALINGEENYQCPARPWLDDPDLLFALYEAFAHYQNGFLLEEGAIVDQPNRLMKAMAILSDQVVLCGEQKQEADRKREEHRQRHLKNENVRGR
jgi:hypothetical protein